MSNVWTATKKVLLGIVFVSVMALPVHAQTAKGVVTLTANATDVTPVAGDLECGIAFVQFFQGSTAISPQITTPSSGSDYTFDLDTKTLPNGSYQITAKAFDKAGIDGTCDGSAPNIGTSNILSLIVGNPDVTPPTITITVDLHLTGTVTVTGGK